MNINQYAPKQVYESINAILNDFKLQSDALHSVISSLDLQCTNYNVISEAEIDGLIDTVRNYTLIKESCLEQSSQILDVSNVSSIEDIHDRVRQHEERSLSIMNDILYYAYEFLKIRSNNVITDGLLQDHHEKLNVLINSMLNEFVDIERVSKQLEPYRVALLYITHQISDLTQYAELMYNTFGAILFYNIISGNNIEYNPQNTQDFSHIEITSQAKDSFNIIEELNLFTQPEDESQPTIDFEIPIIAEVKEVIEFDNSTIEDLESIEQLQEEFYVEDSHGDTEGASETTIPVEELPQVAEVYTTVETPVENVQEEPTTNVEETLEAEPSETTEATMPIEDVSTEDSTSEVQSEESESEPSTLEGESSTETTIDTPTENVADEGLEYDENEYIVNNVDYFENLASTIEAKYDESTYIEDSSKAMDEHTCIETFCHYVTDRQFACASLLLKDYSKHSTTLDTLHVQYGLAVGDPCISSDYSVAFMNVANDSLHSWLELSSIFRAMFTCKNKEVECYNFSPYINSLTQSLKDTIFEYVPNFYDILEVFNAIEYNTNYLTGIKLFDESHDIILAMKKKANEMLLYCENTIRPWNHKAMINVTKTLFSSSGGYVYSLIKEISLGNFSVTDKIKAYCDRFTDESGRMLEGIYLDKAIEEYLHEKLSMANTKKNNYNSCDTDINIGYKNKFTNRFTNILQFLFYCIEEMNAISVNCINEDNVQKYRKLKDTFVNVLNSNYNELTKKSNNNDLSILQRAGMLCLAKTFQDMISYTNYENHGQKYFYCELLKTGYFMLDDMYIPYLNDSTSRVYGLEISTRISKHISEVKYIESWKDAIENNLKKSNVGNVKLIVLYLSDIDQLPDNYQEYLDTADSIEYSIEDTFQRFSNEVQRLYLMEVIPNKSVLNMAFELENIVRMAIFDTRNYGFYEMFLDLLKGYIISISEEYYGLRNNVLDYIGQANGYDSDYYSAIADSIDSHKYCISDELMSMYFNSIEYPKDTIDTSQFTQYDEIYSEFREFCDRYASELSSPNGYVFMNEFYDSNIKDIVRERFGSKYDTVSSDDLILHWVRGQGKVNVIYDILVNIGFRIDSHEDIDIHTSKMVLSNHERGNSQPYAIPEYAIFLNGIYNISQTDRNIASLNITQDTLIILDYALSNYERDHVLQNLNKVSNGNRIVLADRCVIMYLTTIPLNLRTLAFKVCSVCDISNSVSCGSNFRIDYIQSFTKDSRCNLLLGREYFGKTYILNSVASILSSNPENVVICVDAFEDSLDTPSIVATECSNMELKVNPIEDWDSFESSMTRYLNKHPRKSIILLIDNVETYIQYGVTTTTKDSVSPLDVFKKLSNRFKDRFTFTMTADIYYEYIAFAESNELSYTTLKPLSYDETATLFENHLNASRVFVKDREVMTMLVSKAFGCPEMVRLISKQIILTISGEQDVFNDSYLYSLSLDMVNKALSSTDFMGMVGQVFLSTVIGSKEERSAILPVVYAIVYYIYEHSTEDTFTVVDVKNVLSIFDIEEGDILSVKNVLEELQTLGLVCKYTNDEYFLAHEHYKTYLGSKEFAFDMLDYCTKIFTKEGIAQ